MSRLVQIYRSLFGKKSSHKVISTTEHEVQKNPTIAKGVLDKETDAMVVRGFLSDTKCEEILSKVNSLNAKLKIETPFGAMYGKILVGADDMNHYFELAELINQELRKVLGLNIIDKLNKLFGDLINFKPAVLDNKTYAHGTLREFEPQKGGLHAHAEAEFISYLPEFEAFRKGTVLSSQLNYLLILQEPDEGGDLILYDLQWKDTPEKLRGKYEFHDHYRFREPIISKYKQEVIPLKTGDLLLFNGINIWHGVTEIKGSKTRKTFAGFIAKKNGEDDYIVYN